MSSRRSEGLVLVALVPNLFEKGGRELLEAARRLDGSREGRCVYLEADMDALALLDEAERLGAEVIVLVGPGEGEPRYVEPLDSSSIDPGRVVKELWMNLTGSLGLDDYVAALRVLSRRGFYVVPCGGGCGEALKLVRERFCRGEA